MAGEEEDDVALLVLDGHDVEQAPEGAGVLPIAQPTCQPVWRSLLRRYFIEIFVVVPGLESRAGNSKFENH